MWREDEWFQGLAVDARLLWLYLITNPSANAAGIYKLPLRTIAFESGIDLDRVREIMDNFSANEKAHYENGVVWVVKMRKYQFPNPNAKIMRRIELDLEGIPDCRIKSLYLAYYGYTTDRVSNGYPYSTDEQNQNQNQTEQEPEPGHRSNASGQTQTTTTTATPLIRLYMDASGETGHKSEKWRKWFDDVTGRYSRKDCIAAFEKMREDIINDRLDGKTKWERCIWHLEHPESGAVNLFEIPDIENLDYGSIATPKTKWRPPDGKIQHKQP